MDKPHILRLNDADNIVVAIADLPAGTPVEGGIRATRLARCLPGGLVILLRGPQLVAGGGLLGGDRLGVRRDELDRVA